jgi:hypothetical protein
MPRWLVFLAAAFLLANSLVLPAAAAQPRVWVALGGESAPYEEVAAVLRAEWSDRSLTIASWEMLVTQTGSPPDLVVTVGAGAFEGMLKNLKERGPAWESVPLMGTLLPRFSRQATLDRLRPLRRPVSAVVLDQPVSRQLALIQRALPARQRIGILVGSQTRPYLKNLEQEARARGMQLITTQEISTKEDIFPALRQTLEQADVLLALPDTLVYNSTSLQHILLTTYRARVPVVTFSPVYVKAGALLAVYSSPAQVARQVVGQLRHWQPGQPLPALSSSEEFAVVANLKVAASLGIGLDDVVQIAEDLRDGEGRR